MCRVDVWVCVGCPVGRHIHTPMYTHKVKMVTKKPDRLFFVFALAEERKREERDESKRQTRISSTEAAQKQRDRWRTLLRSLLGQPFKSVKQVAG